jgi:type VI secretion system secreted protein VgrG
MASNSTSHHELFFLAEGIELGFARVRRIEQREGLSIPAVAEVDIELPSALDPRAWLLLPAHVVAHRNESSTILRRFSGVVTRVRAHGSRGMKQRVSLTLESPLAVLRQSRDHRIFQNATTKQIVAQILEGAGVLADQTAWRLSGSYPEREVCTQLGETSFAFVSRLLEEDGIFYFVTYGEEGPIIVFGDSSSAYETTTPEEELPYRGTAGLVAEQAVLDLREAEHVRPGKVTLRDHDFKRPALDLESVAQGDSPLGLEHYDYPGRYVDPGEGKRRAQIRLDAMNAEATGAPGESTAFSLAAGHAFKLTGAPNADLDQEWVVRDIVHLWDDTNGAVSHYRNQFHLLPKSATFRPLARTPRAIASGPHLGVITGPAGEEIYTDQFGRVKVHFFWDRRSARDEKSSAWIRVGQMHSSGSVAVPRVGWEVIVDFEDGDPDKPIVAGRLYNGKNGPPYALPGSKTISALKSHSSPGGSGNNEIRMEDGAGGEHVSMRAQKDLNINVANNKTQKVATNEVSQVGANETVKIGANETVKIGADSSLTVGAAQTWAVGASRTKTIGDSESITVKGSRSLSIGGSHTTMTPMTVSTTTSSSLSETVGGSCIDVAALGVGVCVAGAASMTVGGSKIAAVASGMTDVTVGAKASTVGGAFIAATGKDVTIGVGGAKATTVGGAWAAAAGGDFEFSSGASLNITVGGAVSMNAAEIILKVGGSNVTISAGQVALKASSISLIATGPQAELAALVEDK